MTYIPDSDTINICSNTQVKAFEGYIATPNFPNKYPPSMDCQCSLRVIGRTTRIQLQAIHFIIKYDDPCKDWLEVKMGTQRRKLCGAYRLVIARIDT